MRRLSIALIAFCCIASQGLALGPDWVGRSAPEFTLKTLDGRSTLSLSDFRGQVVVIDFWASWCAPCKRSLPKLDALAAALKGVAVLAVNIDDERRNGLEFLRQRGIRLTALHDAAKEVVAGYDVPAMPSALVVDRKGIVRFVHAGYTDGDIEQIRKQIQELL